MKAEGRLVEGDEEPQRCERRNSALPYFGTQAPFRQVAETFGAWPGQQVGRGWQPAVGGILARRLVLRLAPPGTAVQADLLADCGSSRAKVRVGRELLPSGLPQ